jgi:hypothetical protein
MAEKTKLKWLRKEFSSSEELEYYLAQLKHQDKLKSDLITLLQRFQHLLFASYEPDYLTITYSYNGQWDVNFGANANEEPKRRMKPDVSTNLLNSTKLTEKSSAKATHKSRRGGSSPVAERVDLKTLLDAQMLSAGARLRHKNQPSLIATVTRDGHLKVGKEEYQSPSGAATSFAASGRRDGWLCWMFQDKDGVWKPIDILRERWREKHHERATTEGENKN